MPTSTLSDRQFPVAARLDKLLTTAQVVAAAIRDNAEDHAEPFPHFLRDLFLQRLEHVAATLNTIPTTTTTETIDGSRLSPSFPAR